MFEYNKLRKHFMEAVGFAYEFLPNDRSGKKVMQLYIVVKRDDYEFIKYRKYKLRTSEMLYVIIDEFHAKPLAFYANKETNIPFQKVKKI